MSAQGVDASSYQGPNWSPPGGLTFALCKATESTGWTDPYVTQNLARIKRAGLIAGTYHFFHPAVDAVAQAQHFWAVSKAAGIQPGDMMFLDIEIASGGRLPQWFHRRATASPKVKALRDGQAVAREHPPRFTRAHTFQRSVRLGSLSSAALTCLQALQQMTPAGVIVGWYTYTSFLPNLGPLIGKAPLWLAQYSSTAPTSASWMFWQWADTAPGGGDSDAFNGSAAELRQIIAGYQPAPPSPPKPVPVPGQEETMNITRDDFTRNGGSYPIALATAATAVRFYSNSPAILRVDTRSSDGVVPVNLSYDSAHVVPCQVNAIVVHRDDPTDTGTNDVSYAVIQ
jgi:hypothetical protein